MISESLRGLVSQKLSDEDFDFIKQSYPTIEKIIEYDNANTIIILKN